MIKTKIINIFFVNLLYFILEQRFSTFFLLLNNVYVYFKCIEFYFIKNYKIQNYENIIFNAQKEIKLNICNYYGLHFTSMRQMLLF